MSDSRKHRRRQSLSSVRFSPPRSAPRRSAAAAGFATAERAAAGAVGVVVVALITLIWLVATHTIQDQQTERRDQAEHALLAQAATMAEGVAHELLLIDQSLAVIQAAWQQNGNQVDLDELQRTMPALAEVADDLFICDEKHVIHQDVLPRAVGQPVGSTYVTFPHGTLEQYDGDGAVMPRQGGSGTPIEARQFLMYLVRPLDYPEGWLVGASYRSAELTKLFAQAGLGNNPLVALFDIKRSALQAVVGPAARRPNTDLSRTSLFAMLTRSPSGTWLGASAIDGFERLHAFHRVADRDMVVLVAESWAEVMAPADSLATATRALAVIAIGMVTAIGALILWGFHAIRANRATTRLFDRNRNELERLRTDAAAAAASAHLEADRLQVLINNVTDGVAVFDADLRLAQWNFPFLQAIGVPLRLDMPLDTLLRDQATTGLFGPDPMRETEIARRVGVLLTGDAAGLAYPGPGQTGWMLHGHPTAQGGLILLLRDPDPVYPQGDDRRPVAASSPTASIEW